MQKPAIAMAVVWLGVLFGSEATAQEVQYNRDVRPILSNNCFFCHGFDEGQREAGLRLDTLAGVEESGAVEPGDPDSSSLIDRIFSDDPDLVMPPSGSAYSLTDSQKNTLKRWIKQGANYEQHWAYKKLQRPDVQTTNAKHPIDVFLRRRWKSEKLQPVGNASPRQLIRRLSYDLRGLPPTSEEVRVFQADPSGANYRLLVEKWTRSIEYAEHQGLIWLDLVRWADSTGMVSDEPIATGAYRAYVIEAFRDNMPFDQFTREQLAGDLLPEVNDRTLVASGYNRLVKTNSEAGVIEKEALHALKGEHEAYTNQFQTTVENPARAVRVGDLPALGEKVRLVLKEKILKKSPHDPVGIAWMQIGGRVTWGNTGFNLTTKNAFAARLAESTNRYFWHLPWNRDDREHRMKLMVDSLKKPEGQRRRVHQDVIRFAFQESRQLDVVGLLRSQYQRLETVRQQAVDEALVSKVGPLKETKLRLRGNFMDDSGDRLNPAVLGFLDPSASNGDGKGGRSSRLDLANWLVDRINPLTARVFVNRLWFQFYGRGISETLEDAGNQGDWPSHPYLLDWLAVEFIESGWDVRHIVELMVTSDAYRLSSIPSPALSKSDPTNRFHARQGRSRLTAEEIRDSALRVAGLLKRTTEIPTRSFFSYQPKAYWAKSNKVMFGSRHMLWDTNRGESQYQRSLYTYWKRQNPHPSMLAFDAPTRQECTAKRPTTNTPGQALALLNDPIFVEAARALAESVLVDSAATTPEDRISLVFQKTLQRDATGEELQLVKDSLASFTEHFQNDPGAAKALLEVGQKKSVTLSPVEFAAWTATCRMIVNLHEFITRS
jgi:hypothetical protein